MKNFSVFLILTALVAFNSTALASGPDETEIELHKINPTTRSLMDTPEASIKQDILSASFDASGIYSLYVENSFGDIVYSSTLPANGMEHDYDLSGIGTGLLRLVIEGQGGKYEGYFFIH